MQHLFLGIITASTINALPRKLRQLALVVASLIEMQSRAALFVSIWFSLFCSLFFYFYSFIIKALKEREEEGLYLAQVHTPCGSCCCSQATTASTYLAPQSDLHFIKNPIKCVQGVLSTRDCNDTNCMTIYGRTRISIKIFQFNYNVMRRKYKQAFS